MTKYPGTKMVVDTLLGATLPSFCFFLFFCLFCFVLFFFVLQLNGFRLVGVHAYHCDGSVNG